MVVERYFTVPEVAEMLRKHPNTIRNDIRDGKLQAKRLGGRNSLRISVTEYSRYVESLEKEAKEN